jgi:hypothetical protein
MLANSRSRADWISSLPTPSAFEAAPQVRIGAAGELHDEADRVVAAEHRRQAQHEFEGNRDAAVFPGFDQGRVLEVDRRADFGDGQAGGLAHAPQRGAGPDPDARVPTGRACMALSTSAAASIGLPGAARGRLRWRSAGRRRRPWRHPMSSTLPAMVRIWSTRRGTAIFVGALGRTDAGCRLMGFRPSGALAAGPRQAAGETSRCR